MKYANELAWSEVYPYEVVKVVSPITLEIRAMGHDRHPDWEPEIIAGGFAGCCVNQHEQKWLYSSNPEGEVLRIRKSKDGYWTHKGRIFKLADEPMYYYDYNI